MTRLSAMHTRALPTLLATLLALAGCAPRSDRASSSTVVDAAAVRQAIDSANARFLDALKRSDTVAIVAAYTDDAVVMVPNMPAWRGRDGIRQGFGGFLSQMSITDGRLTTQDVMVAGELAVETGAYEWTLRPRSGKETTDKGKYLTVWKRQADGSWRIVRDINNSDLPPAP